MFDFNILRYTKTSQKLPNILSVLHSLIVFFVHRISCFDDKCSGIAITAWSKTKTFSATIQIQTWNGDGEMELSMMTIVCDGTLTGVDFFVEKMCTSWSQNPSWPTLGSWFFFLYLLLKNKMNIFPCTLSTMYIIRYMRVKTRSEFDVRSPNF